MLASGEGNLREWGRANVKEGDPAATDLWTAFTAIDFALSRFPSFREKMDFLFAALLDTRTPSPETRPPPSLLSSSTSRSMSRVSASLLYQGSLTCE